MQNKYDTFKKINEINKQMFYVGSIRETWSYYRTVFNEETPFFVHPHLFNRCDLLLRLIAIAAF